MPRAIRATRCPRGFFLQVFLSVLNLLLVFVGYWSHDVELAVWTIYIYVAYRQLFGYGRWSTLWRLVIVVLTQWVVLLIAAGIVIYFYGFDGESKADPETNKGLLIILAVTVVLVAVMLLVTHVINRRSHRSSPRREGP